MTYLSSESAVESQPVEMYDIAMGLTHWRLTSCGEDYTYSGWVYENAPCRRGEIKQTGEIPKDGMTFELPRGHALGLLCQAGALDEEVTMTVYRGHDTFFITYFKGFLTNFDIDENNIYTLLFEPRSSDMPFIGGRRRLSILCDLKFGGYRCQVNREAYKTTGLINIISGVTITATELSTSGLDFAHGGEIIVRNAHRTIIYHSGNTIKISKPFSSDVVARAPYSAYASCDHLITTCKNVYNNIPNYGGQIALPRKNPFASGSHLFH